jgi:hypothetical protein
MLLQSLRRSIFGCKQAVERELPLISMHISRECTFFRRHARFPTVEEHDLQAPSVTNFVFCPISFRSSPWRAIQCLYPQAHPLLQVPIGTLQTAWPPIHPPRLLVPRPLPPGLSPQLVLPLQAYSEAPDRPRNMPRFKRSQFSL